MPWSFDELRWWTLIAVRISACYILVCIACKGVTDLLLYLVHSTHQRIVFLYPSAVSVQAEQSQLSDKLKLLVSSSAPIERSSSSTCLKPVWCRPSRWYRPGSLLAKTDDSAQHDTLANCWHSLWDTSHSALRLVFVCRGTQMSIIMRKSHFNGGDDFERQYIAQYIVSYRIAIDHEQKCFAGCCKPFTSWSGVSA